MTQPARYNNAGEVVSADTHRIVDLQFDGKPIDPKQVFVVAANNYRASGGGNFPGLGGDNIIIVAPDTNRDVLANYIFDLKKLDPSADGNWSFAPIAGDVKVTFTTGPKAAETLDDKSPIRAAGAAEDGFAKYELLFDKPES